MRELQGSQTPDLVPRSSWLPQLWYSGSMKVKTSITLSEDVVKTVERLAKKGESRSEAIERLLRGVFVQQARRAQDQNDLEIINKHADQLNEEAEDVLEYQVEL